jgi:putative molybdopterin biosynthesis protein
MYLHDIPLPEAQKRIEAALESAGLGGPLEKETIPLDASAAGRVLAEPVWAKLSSPHYHAAAMDGFAVAAADTHSAGPGTPVSLAVGEKAAYVDTGDVLPSAANAVIPIENVEPLDARGELAPESRSPAHIRIRAAVAPWTHVRPMGEDLVATQLILPAGQTLRPVDLGAVAAGGHDSAVVARKPRVAILPTGSELTPIGHTPKPGQIIEYNGLVLAAQIGVWGGAATIFPITPDDFKQIKARVKAAARDHDLILLNAGSSAGAEDFSAKVIEELGELHFHGVAVRPGHPVIFGMVKQEGKSVPVFGVPGYPVSAALTGEIFIEPLLARWLGRPPHQPEIVTAELTRKITSPPGDDDYVRVAVGRVGKRLLAAPLPRGAGVISSLARADGQAVLPRGSQGEEAGAKVQVRLYRQRNELEKTIFAVGSHDIALDLMAQSLAKHDRRLVSSNVGSVAGLVALSKGEAHLAGSHLLDPQTGEYNVTYFKEYLPGARVKLVVFVFRQQGLMVAKGNPKRIEALEDLTREDVRFANRQRGAGTRVLLDYHLDKQGIAAGNIQGYNLFEYTHLAVAAAVASGRADCGLGIAAAAQALGLDFIPLFEERYDLVIPEEHYRSSLLAPLLASFQDQELRKQIEKLPGYDIKRMGELIEVAE